MAKPRRLGSPPRRIPAVTDWTAQQTVQRPLPIDPSAFAIAPSPYANEVGPMRGPGNPWLESLSSLADVQTPQYTPGMTTGDQFGTALVAALARTIGERQLQQQQARAAQNAYQMQQAAERNKENLAASKSAAADRLTSLRDQQKYEHEVKLAEINAGLKQPRLVEVRTPSGGKVMQPAEAGLQTEPPPGAAMGFTYDRSGKYADPDVVSWGDRLVNGEAKWSDIPAPAKTAVNSYLSATKQTVLPQKVRDTQAVLNAAESVIDQIETLVPTVNTSGPGLGRFGTGLGKMAGAVTQKNEDAALFTSATKGWLSTLARASGEKGTLAEGDIARAKTIPPSIFDTGRVARRKIAQMRRFIQEMREKTVKTYTSPAPKLIGSQPSPQTASPFDVVEQDVSGGK